MIASKVEKFDRERWKRNVMVFNQKESTEAEARDMIRDDEEEEVVRRMVGEAVVTKLLRLGQRTENRCRPLLVNIEREDKRKEISQRAWALRCKIICNDVRSYIDVGA